MAVCVLGACAADAGPAAQRGFDACAADPNSCNAGQRADGGSITWVVSSRPGAWTGFSPEGGTAYTLQMLHGVLPHTGMWLPDRTDYQFNLDLLAEEPRLLNDDPASGFSYQFVLRDDAVWDDGTSITVDDFLVTWYLSTSPERGLCGTCRSRAPASWDRIESIEGSNDGKTITINLQPGHADPEWFGSFGLNNGLTGGIVPAHVAEQQGIDWKDPAQVGEYFAFLNDTMPTFSGGPYRLVEGDLANYVIKEPNEAWYGEVHPTLDTVVIRFISDESQWVPAVTNGEVHGASPLAFNEDVLRQLQQLPNLNVNITAGPLWDHIDFNMDVPAFADVNLRRAIFMAIDVEDIADRTVGSLFPDYTLRTNHAFAAWSPYHVDYMTETRQGSGDIEAARAILEEAGYEWDAAGTLRLNGEQIGPFRLRSTSSAIRDVATALVQSHLADLGIEITVQSTDDLGGMLAKQDYDLVLFGSVSNPFFVTQTAQAYRTGSPTNFGNYSNARVDELVAQQLEATTPEDAAEIANQVGAVVAQDAYSLPIIDSPVYTFVTDDYVNVRENSTIALRALYNHHEWGLVAH